MAIWLGLHTYTHPHMITISAKTKLENVWIFIFLSVISTDFPKFWEKNHQFFQYRKN